jgi:hypothetical protein
MVRMNRKFLCLLWRSTFHVLLRAAHSVECDRMEAECDFSPTKKTSFRVAGLIT